MLGWLLIAVALAALIFYPGLGGLVVVAGAVLWYLIARSRSLNDEVPPPGAEESAGTRRPGNGASPGEEGS